MCEQDPIELELLGESGQSDNQRSGTSGPLRRAVARLVLDTTAEGIWLIDAQARTTFVNRRTADLLGYTEQEMLGKHVFAFIPLADRRRKSEAA